jgi:hypothetical protein
MNQERERALGQFITLKKQIYELGIKAHIMVKNINDETDLFLSNKDFSSMDFEKVETFAKELQLLQKDFKEKAGRMEQLQTIYNL